AQVLVLDVARQPIGVEETESLDVGDDLAQRLGQCRHVQRWVFARRVVEEELLGEDRFPRPRLPHHDVDGVAGESAAKNLIRLGISGLNAIAFFDALLILARPVLAHGVSPVDADVLRVASTSRTVSTSRCSASGFMRNASAPASSARACTARMLKISTTVPWRLESALIRRQSERPSILGTSTSVMTMSGRILCACSSAPTPSAANSTENPASF